MIAAPDIPGHTITGVLGTGGFATVYRSWQVAVGREVAVKVDNRVLLSERDQRRFFREVTAAGRLSGHPHVIDVYDAGTLGDGRPYLVMELCPAGSLHDELRQRGPLSPARVRHIGVGLADALAAAHAADVLHRDIKPANVLVNQYGMVGLSDFGLASIIAAGGQQSATRDALTPAYAAPECFRSAEPTAVADVYSLAATLYALLAGRPPRFPAGGQPPGLAAILALHGRPVDEVAGTPPELLAVLRRCLAADPAARLPTAAALRDALIALSEASARSLVPAAADAGRPAAAAVHQPVRADPAAAPVSVPTGPAAPPGPAAAPPGTDRAASGAARRRLPAGTVALVSGSALLIAAAVGLGTYLRAPGNPPTTPAPSGVHGPMAPAPSVFGIPTETSGCAAASVRTAAARCPTDPECWNGTVDIEGSVTARSEPCSRPHGWETFAIAILPADVATFDQDVVEQSPVVRAVCSLRVLLRSRAGRARRIPPKDWEIQVIPPDEAAYDGGARAYRCVATTVTGPSLAVSAFSR